VWNNNKNQKKTTTPFLASHRHTLKKVKIDNPFKHPVGPGYNEDVLIRQERE
jgi:hypothetical protein